MCWHALRSMCVTLSFPTSVHPNVVSERLGHASISETLNRYFHVTAARPFAQGRKL
jgi:integrase